MIVHRTTRFKREFKKMPTPIQNDFLIKIVWFMEDVFDIRLRTHALKGALADCYAFCLRDGYRVLFQFKESQVVLLLTLGDHDSYRRWQ